MSLPSIRHDHRFVSRIARRGTGRAEDLWTFCTGTAGRGSRRGRASGACSEAGGLFDPETYTRAADGGDGEHLRQLTETAEETGEDGEFLAFETYI